MSKPISQSTPGLKTVASGNRASLAFLIAANLMPLAGVVFFEWDAGFLILAYWFENLVIGFYALGKMFLANKPPEGEAPEPLFSSPLIIGGKLFMMAFFVVHFGGFCALHGVFILFMTGLSPVDVFEKLSPDWPGPLVFPALLIGVLRAVFAERPPGVEILLVVLFLSHGFSFAQNFIGKREYLRTNIEDQMNAPYGRITVIHIAIIVGAAPVMALGSPLPLLVLLIVGKVALDLHFHRRSHRKWQEGETPGSEKEKENSF